MQAALPTYTEFDSLSPGQWNINVSDCTAIQPAPVAAGVADRAISIRLQISSVNTPIILLDIKELVTGSLIRLLAFSPRPYGRLVFLA
jgi:hypothetical protein